MRSDNSRKVAVLRRALLLLFTLGGAVAAALPPGTGERKPDGPCTNAGAVRGYWALGAPRTVLVRNQEWENSSPHSLTIVKANMGGHAYWGYYGLEDGCGAIGLAWSDDLLRWTKSGSNPLFTNGRWPSVLLEKGAFYMAYEKDYCETSYVRLATSTDGIRFSELKTLVQPEPGVKNQNPHLFFNQNDRKYYLYWYRGNDKLFWEVRARSAGTIQGLEDPSSEVTVLASNSTLAAPNILFHDGIYYLSTETLGGEGWNVTIFSSKVPTSGFRSLPLNPALSEGAACMSQYVIGPTLHVYYCKQTGSTWTVEHRSADLYQHRPSYAGAGRSGPAISAAHILLPVFVFSSAITYLVLRCSKRLGLVDVPNSRSSHSRPTARGGGFAIVVTTVGALLALRGLDLVPRDLVIAVSGGGGLVAAVGLADDLRRLPATIRICAHFFAAGWGLYWLGGMPLLDVGLGAWQWGVLGNVAGVIGLVWLVNLTNFMDGIDGLAAAEIAFVAVAAGTTIARGTGVAPACFIIAASCAGFLVFNWPPARIFMGDTGSGFLGYSIGILMLAQARQQPPCIWAWLILLGVFITDATLTLLRRALRKERIYEAHRSHAYQHAAVRWGHLRVTSGITAVNLLWLAPFALVAASRPGLALVLFAVAIAPLTSGAVLLRAGVASRTPGPLRAEPGSTSRSMREEYHVKTF